METKIDWRNVWMQRFYQKEEHESSYDAWITLLRREMPANARVLEVGGGPVDFSTRELVKRGNIVVGVDVDPVLRTNTLLSTAHVYDGEKFPIKDGEFQMVVSRWVNEHLEKPAAHFEEVYRVLAPGGCYLFRTINLLHYSASVARITPHWVHVRLVRWLKHLPDEQEDPYPTFYRANTISAIRRLADATGFDIRYEKLSEYGSQYGLANRAIFLAFMVYERTVNRFARLAPFRHTIDCVLQKPL